MKKYDKNRIKRICLGGILAALSIVFGKLLAFNIGELFRISLENLPIILGGIFLGPIYGMIVGMVADLVGCLIVGYTINPLITLGAMAVGLVSGVVAKMLTGERKIRAFLSVFLAHLIGSVLIKSAGLAWFYGTDYLTLLGYRCINYAAIVALEYTIIYILTKNKSVSAMLERLGGRKNDDLR